MTAVPNIEVNGRSYTKWSLFFPDVPRIPFSPSCKSMSTFFLQHLKYKESPEQNSPRSIGQARGVCLAFKFLSVHSMTRLEKHFQSLLDNVYVGEFTETEILDIIVF